MFQWEIIVENIPFLIKGFKASIEIFVISLILGSVLGLIMGILRTSNHFAIKMITRAFIEVFRGLPILITMFLVFFAVPMVLHVDIPSVVSAVIGLSLWCLSEVAEIVRGAVQSIPKGQTEAGRAMALDSFQIKLYILLPQAFRRMLPPLIGIYTRLLKGTAMASLIGVNDLLMSGQVVIERTMAPLEIYTFIMICFFMVCYPLSILSTKLEKRLLVSNSR